MTSRQRWTLLSVCIATFMLLLDVTVVNVALPAIAADLKTQFSDLQWVIDAYALGLAALLLTAGSLADIFGRRRVFVAGVALFTVASGLCGLAGSPLVLELARALQGIGAAGMFATALALLAATFQGRQRATAFGVWGAVTGAAVAVGPLIGGVLVEHVSWQSIFLVNLPIGVAVIVVALREVEESKGTARSVDVIGVVTFCAGLFFGVFAMVRGNAEGWTSGLILAFAGLSVVLLALFVIHERRTAEPMLDLRLFAKRAFTGAALAAFALSASIFSVFLYLTLYIQNALGFSPLQAGLRFLPITLLSFVAAPIAGKLTERVPARLLIGGGLTLAGIGLVLMAQLDASSAWTALLPGFVVAGIGIGMTNPPLASTAVGVVAPQHSGMASGINTTFRQVGIAVGIAAYGAIFQSRLASKFPGGPPGDVLAGGSPKVLGPGKESLFLTGYTQSLNELLIIAAVVAFAGAVAGFLLVRPADFVAHGEPAPAPSDGMGEPVAQARVQEPLQRR